MKTKTVRLDDETRAVFLNASIDGCRLTLNGQLPRPVYQKVAKSIEAAGGKWNRSAGCHIFPHDVRETFNITTETVEVTNIKQTFQAFYTPPDVASQVILWAGIEANQRILEPSAGDGALVRALPNIRRELVLVEINPKCAAKLEMYGEVITGDFMEQNGRLGKFDRVIMNPPFTGGQDVKHILHARSFLKPKGRLVALCAAGSRQSDKLKPLATHWEDLPAGSFKEQGTGVNVALLVIEG